MLQHVRRVPILIMLLIPSALLPAARGAMAYQTSAAQVQLASATVKPGAKQTVTVRTAPGALVRITVDYPYREVSGPIGAADADGLYRWTYTQPANVIAHASRKASVTVMTGTLSSTGPAFSGPTISASYRVGYGPIDLSPEPRVVRPGATFTVWVHTVPRATTQLHLSDAAAASRGIPEQAVQVSPNAGGWALKQFTLPSSLSGGDFLLPVGARTNDGRQARTTVRVATIDLTAVILNLRLLHQVQGEWTPTMQIHPGEQARIAIEWQGTEFGLISYVPTYDATLTVTGGGQTVFSGAMRSESTPMLVADLTLPPSSKPGIYTARVTLGEGAVTDTKSLRFELLPG